MTAIASFCALCFLLVCGKAVRTAIPFLRKLYLPSSIVGGALGLILLTSFGSCSPAEWHEGWKSIPGFLINIVFATMFIGKKFPNVRNTGRAVVEQFCFAQIIAWGMYVVGLALSVLVFTPCFGVQPAFGNLLEIGFEGGHGTVGGLSETFTALAKPWSIIRKHWESGRWFVVRVIPTPPLPTTMSEVPISVSVIMSKHWR